MRTLLPPRLRAPVLFAVLAAAVLAAGGAAWGWNTIPDVVPIPIVVAVGLYLWGGRDSDAGAVIRRHLDERQADARLRVQALVGRVLSLAVAVGFLIAANSKSTLWPWAVLLGLTVVALVVGWIHYGEHHLGRPRSRG